MASGAASDVAAGVTSGVASGTASGWETGAAASTAPAVASGGLAGVASGGASGGVCDVASGEHPSPEEPDPDGGPPRPALTELRLSAFKSFRGARLPLGPLTVLAGASGTGKTNALEALAVLGRLGGGETVAGALAPVRGGPGMCVPLGTPADRQGRRGIRLGCTVEGRLGPVRLDVAVQIEPEPRIVGERLTCAGKVLLETALRDPRGRTVQAAWHTAGAVPVTRGPLPGDRLGSALLPLRVAGTTQGQRLVLAAAEQLVVGLRSVFCVAPEPRDMRGWVAVADGLLEGGGRNLSAVVARTETECRIRHGLLGAAMRALCPYPVEGVTVVPGGDGTVMAALDRGPLGLLPAAVMGEGELRALALALVLLTGPGILAMDPAEVPDALRLLTVLAHDVDRGLDRRQTRELLGLAARMCERGHVRVVATAHAGEWVRELPGVTVAEPAPGERRSSQPSGSASGGPID
jgi:hypothetical protein